MRPLAVGAALCLAACSSGPDGDTDSWQLLGSDQPGALMSVWAAGPDDVWAVGADTGDGSTVLHYDGQQWERMVTGSSGDLWWVHGFVDGPVFVGGDDGQILRYDGVDFAPLTTPGGTGTVFGIWGASPDDVWAVGGDQGGSSGAFIWRLVGGEFVLAEGFPTELEATDAIWKVFGRAADDVAFVGTNGNVLRYDGQTLAPEELDASVSLFTVSGNAQRLIAVGGFASGVILENEGAGWVDVSPDGAPLLIGVAVAPDDAYAVGVDGVVYRRGDDGAWALEPTGLGPLLPLHGACFDTSGGFWAVGGQVLSGPLVSGYLIHKGSDNPEGFE